MIFHGSPYKFKRFKKENQGRNYGPGIYLTEDFDEAVAYALASDEAGYVYEVDVKANKPFDPYSEKHAKKIADYLYLDWDKVLADELYKDSSTGAVPQDKHNYYMKLGSVIYDNGSKAYKVLPETIKFLGFDSIHDPIRGWWVVEQPRQAKIIGYSKIPYEEYSLEEYQQKQKELSDRRDQRIEKYNPKLLAALRIVLGEKKPESAPSLKPPKEWFAKITREIRKGNPSYSEERIRKTIGDIWYNELSDAKRKEIRERYGKKYGEAS